MAKQFNVIEKTVDLLDYTLTITSNKKRYPSKYIELVRYIVRVNLEIFDCITNANDMNITTEKAERIQLQTKAVNYCNKLSKLAELSLRRNLIGTDTLCYWQKLISNVKYMTLGWREADKKR